jgi:hypothetical protein
MYADADADIQVVEEGNRGKYQYPVATKIPILLKKNQIFYISSVHHTFIIKEGRRRGLGGLNIAETLSASVHGMQFGCCEKRSAIPRGSGSPSAIHVPIIIEKRFLKVRGRSPTDIYWTIRQMRLFTQ